MVARRSGVYGDQAGSSGWFGSPSAANSHERLAHVPRDLRVLRPVTGDWGERVVVEHERDLAPVHGAEDSAEGRRGEVEAVHVNRRSPGRGLPLGPVDRAPPHHPVGHERARQLGRRRAGLFRAVRPGELGAGRAEHAGRHRVKASVVEIAEPRQAEHHHLHVVLRRADEDGHAGADRRCDGIHRVGGQSPAVDDRLERHELAGRRRGKTAGDRHADRLGLVQELLDRYIVQLVNVADGDPEPAQQLLGIGRREVGQG